MFERGAPAKAGAGTRVIQVIAVFIESAADGTLPKSSLIAVNAALQAKQAHKVDRVVGVVLGGSSAKQAGGEAAQYGLDEVVVVSAPSLERYLALNYEAAWRGVISELSPTMILAASTSTGKDLLPRLAVILGAGQASDVTQFLEGGRFRRAMYAGNVVADVELVTAAKVVTIRVTAFDAATKAPAPCAVRELSVDVPPDARQEFVSFDTVKSERPELTTARTVVSGGRAMKSAENFEKYLAPLADVLGAAIGASRAAVDSGYAPNDWQVGQTGKVVAPALYIAVGISGAIQHLAGMKDSKVIVAINKDGDAPIFEVADYGLVADLYTALPELTEAIRRVKGG